MKFKFPEYSISIDMKKQYKRKWFSILVSILAISSILFLKTDTAKATLNSNKALQPHQKIAQDGSKIKILASSDSLPKAVAYPWVVRPDLFQFPISAGGDQIFEPRVVGGSSYTPENKYPWIASLQYEGNHYCGGTLIDPDWILTAAHCWVDANGNEYVPNIHDTVVLGEYDFSVSSGFEQVINVAEVHIHPEHDYLTFENDFALLKLASSASITTYVQTIPIVGPSPGNLNYTPAIITGWGDYYYQQPSLFNNLVHEGFIDILPDSACSNYGTFFDSTSMLCGGVLPDYNVDACQGDSGGALFYDDGGQMIVAGVTSWGNGCAEEGFPGIYARISSASIWINTLLGNLEGDIEVTPSSLHYTRDELPPSALELSASSNATNGITLKNHFDHISQIIKEEGQARIILELNTGWQPNSSLSAIQSEQQSNHLADIRSQFITEMRDYGAIVHKVYDLYPYIAMEINEAALIHLASSPLVKNIEEDKVYNINLNESIPLIDADDAWTWGYTGAGQTVAVLDTGIRKDHIAFGGNDSRVVEEACFSGFSPEESLCPDGSNIQIGSGSADATVDACFVGATNICGHGTHVAGIMAGNNSAYSGVAPDANIIAIQVFSKYIVDGYVYIGAYTSDLLLGLQHVYSLRNSYDIAAINLSLGGDYFNSSCDSEISSVTTIVNDLKMAGIATVAASGNEYYSDGLGWPACISNVVSVGNTTKFNEVEDSSNSATFLDLLAPGTDIISADVYSTSGFTTKTGTSMAAPHVAGAWAVIASAHPEASVDDILNALKDTGLNITDSGNGITKPRIDIDNAILWPAAFNISNLGTGYLEITDLAIMDSSCWLEIYHEALPRSVSYNGSFPVFVRIDHSCVGAGSYTDSIHIQSNDPDEPDVYIPVQLDVIDITPPPVTALSSPPDGSFIIDTTPTFNWLPAGDASQYQIIVDNDVDFSSPEIDQAVAATQHTSSESLAQDVYSWKVRAADSSDNWGEWSAVWTFTLGTPPAAFNKITPLNGATEQSTNPILTWEASDGAISYEYCIDTTDDNSCSNWTDNGSSTSIQLAGLSLITTYYWHVRANNDFRTTWSNGASNAFWNFTTKEFNDTTPPDGYFLAPAVGGSVLKPRAILSVTASDNLSGVKSVTFSAYYNGDWHSLGTDLDGSDGWKYQWATFNIPEQTIHLKAVIEDFAGNQSPEIFVSNISLSSTFTFGNGYETRSSTGEQSYSGISSQSNWNPTKNLSLDVYQNSGLIPSPRILIY